MFNDVFAGKRVFVTGHTGFKGSWLSAWLIRLGAEVCGFAKDIPTDPSLFQLAALSNEMEHCFADVRDLDSLRTRLLSFRPDFVFHLAAQPIVSLSYADPINTITSNVIGTANILESLREVTWPCSVVIVTSDKCYENVEWPWGYRESDRLGGKDIYSGSKGAAELVVHSYWNSFFGREDSSVRLASARAGNVIGGGDWAKDRIIADCIRAWQIGETVKIRSPRATRPWQHVLEPLSGYLSLAHALFSGREDGESFNFGPRSEQNRMVLEVLSDLGRIWGLPSEAEGYEIVGTVPFHEAGLLKLNCDKALLALKWEPNLLYDECITMTGNWYRDVLRHARGARDVTVEQIIRYEELAIERSRSWSLKASIRSAA